MRRVKIAKAKREWAERFKVNQLKGDPLPPPVAIEQKMAKKMKKLVDRMIKETNKSLIKLFKSETGKDFFAQDASISSQSRILLNDLQRKFAEMFSRGAEDLIDSLVRDADKLSSLNIHESFKKLTGGISVQSTIRSSVLKETIKASSMQASQLIKKIPSVYFDSVAGYVARSITSGQGLADLIPQLERFGGITQRHARNLALDQTRKVYNSINASRIQALGGKKFEWIHSGGGQHPRPLHQSYHGKIFRFDDLPVIDERTGERGIPGQAPNCGCTMRPIFDFGGDDENN